MKVAEWPTVLSVGEQQRVSFIRLLALFTLKPSSPQLVRQTMVLFDEATSAIDAPTECKIYARLIELHVWFVTITHRSSLTHLHAISLRFIPNTDQHQSVEEVRTEIHTPMFNDGGDDGNIFVRRELSHRFPKQIDNQLPLSNVKEKVTPRWRLVFDILRFIHVPFQSTDGVLKLQVRNQSYTTSASGSFHRQWSCGY